jgi:hypothetical protein
MVWRLASLRRLARLLFGEAYSLVLTSFIIDCNYTLFLDAKDTATDKSHD